VSVIFIYLALLWLWFCTCKVVWCHHFSPAYATLKLGKKVNSLQNRIPAHLMMYVYRAIERQVRLRIKKILPLLIIIIIGS